VNRPEDPKPTTPLGQHARAAGHHLLSHRVGLLPIVPHVRGRPRLEETCRDDPPRAERRCRIDPATALLVLLQNLLLGREPLHGIGEWAARHAPDWLGLAQDQIAALHDDRLGRCLDRLFPNDGGSIAWTVAAHAVTECGVKLDQGHHDSTTIPCHGPSQDAAQEQQRKDHTRRAITWRHNKDQPPDLKQPRFLLTIAKDGGVPVDCQAQSGNTVDDQTHRVSGEALRTVADRRDFLLGRRLQTGHRREPGVRASARRPVAHPDSPRPE
jgi:Domain of unknown function (DUF4277)